MQRADLPQVLTIERACYEFPWTEGIFRDCLRMGYRSLVVTNTINDLLGYGLMSFAGVEAHILNICVRRDCRRQGLGEFLLAQLLADAKQSGVAHAMLEVRFSNEAATQLYRKAGFDEIGVRKGYYPAAGGGREDALVLALELTSGP
jgi:ribosomal-protein-alanine N-acetyltransferase